MPTISERMGTMAPIFRSWRLPLPSRLTSTVSPGPACTMSTARKESPVGALFFMVEGRHHQELLALQALVFLRGHHGADDASQVHRGAAYHNGSVSNFLAGFPIKTEMNRQVRQDARFEEPDPELDRHASD